MKIYIAGAMRRKKYFNFPLFDATRDHLRSLGHEVISPADLDREMGFDPMTLPESYDWSSPMPNFDMSEACRRDLEAIRWCDGVALLDGWEGSVGAKAEYAVAMWLSKKIVDPKTGEEVQETSKLSNPKDLIGSNKIPVHLWPTTATIMGSMGLLDGALKYGRSNWRAVGVRASIYVDALQRHMNAWFEGEDSDPDSGLSHLSHALACIAIIVDAQAAGKLNDDRMIKGGYRELVNDTTPHVPRLKKLYESKSPKHFTIKDNESNH